MKKRKIAFSVLLILTSIYFMACSNGSSASENKEKSTYTVTYTDGVDGLDISVPNDTKKYHKGDTVTVKFNDIGNRSEYTFAGWSDGTNTFTSDGTTSFEMGNTDVTLTAQWIFNYIGTKTPSESKTVGDIVFKDGSAMPYTVFNSLDASEKETKKSSAIALIFYKGTELNSGNDTTTSRILGVGLKHNKDGLAWCRKDSDTEYADAWGKKITTIECNHSGSTTVEYTITGDKNGSDNLEQMEAFEGIDDTSTPANYPAFYFGKKYKDITDSNIKDTPYENGWYLPSFAELFQIYACRTDTTNGFDIDVVSEALGGDKFETDVYWSSSQWASKTNIAYGISFQNGGWTATNPHAIRKVCCIREF